MSYKAKVSKLEHLRPHPNADRVQLATCHGNQIVISLNHTTDELGVYFPSDGQLSQEFCHKNNLYRDSTLNLDPKKSGFFDPNRRVRAQKFRGEISDGFWVPLNSFHYISDFNPELGFEFDSINGKEICKKYVNKETIEFSSKQKSIRSSKKSIMFKEHFDTEHFGNNYDKFKEGDLVIITEKLHGTSGRVGNVKVNRQLSSFEKVLKFFKFKIEDSEWTYLNGTRRVVLGEGNANQFHDPTIREIAFDKFNGKLRKGETVYFEIVGYETNGRPIMPSVNTKSLNDKNFTEKYGETMTYSYGCEIGNCDVYVYRISSTNEDGQTIDYSWSDVISRCKELEVKFVPEIIKFVVGDSVKVSENWKDLVPYLANGESSIDSRHISEGVCIRIESGLENKTFKYKSFEFKVLEGIVKDSGQIDEEEAQSIIDP